MKKMKIITPIIAIALAIGGALMTQAEESKAMVDQAMLTHSSEPVQIGYYKLPSNPANCQAFSTVDCNPIEGPQLCTVNINGQMTQLYDSGCADILYRDPVE
ncbi:DUF6520 family protein [Gramella sp. GC03-9]|uniref:DUF6520 family protein n=1 Tax=Christiangramia oceanisediminis TaxID=2920386 RepID=A0A9X2KZY7_9FLAO|nr:DUF6520 family protein [Gramella oceanisediminis]MCP9201316.1 DUF6520 family protein [Gramella oceanisediminis]